MFVLHLLSPQELEPGIDGAVRLVDVEGAGALEITVDEALRRHYRAHLAAFLQGLESRFARRGVVYLRASTATPFEEVVLRGLRDGGLLR